MGLEKFKQIDTPRLLSYSTILENVIVTQGQIMNQAIQFVEEKLYTPEEVQPFVTRAQNIQEEHRGAYFEIQKELDIRMKKDLRIKNGIRKAQNLLEEFEEFTDKKSKEKFAAHQEKQEAAMKLIKADKANDTSAE